MKQRNRHEDGQTDRPHEGPKAHGQTEKERGTETEGQIQGQRQGQTS